MVCDVSLCDSARFGSGAGEREMEVVGKSEVGSRCWLMEVELLELR